MAEYYTNFGGETFRRVGCERRASVLNKDRGLTQLIIYGIDDKDANQEFETARKIIANGYCGVRLEKRSAKFNEEIRRLSELGIKCIY